ncbi:MAG: hypothetical protein GY940_26320, partial [bacterium]|nr:hypothetical protein [bacterium]
MENQPLYRIIFEGRIRAGEDPGQVRARLSSLFKAEPAAIEKVFRDAPTVIQQNLPEEKALKYKTTFEQTGALCRVEKEPTMYQPEPAPESTPGPKQPVIVTGTGAERLTRDAWKAMGIGAVITAVILYFPFLSFVFRYMITLVHEIGHAVFGWFFGYPSVPAFDFAYGGGITMHQ